MFILCGSGAPIKPVNKIQENVTRKADSSDAVKRKEDSTSGDVKRKEDRVGAVKRKCDSSGEKRNGENYRRALYYAGMNI